MFVYMMCDVCVYMFLSALTVDLESKQNYEIELVHSTFKGW